MRCDEINDQMRDMFLSTNKRFNELYGFFNKGIMALLKWWGEPDQIMGAFLGAIEERERKIREEEQRIENLRLEKIRKEQEEKERLEEEEKELRRQELKA